MCTHAHLHKRETRINSTDHVVIGDSVSLHWPFAGDNYDGSVRTFLADQLPPVHGRVGCASGHHLAGANPRRLRRIGHQPTFDGPHCDDARVQRSRQSLLARGVDCLILVQRGSSIRLVGGSERQRRRDQRRWSLGVVRFDR